MEFSLLLLVTLAVIVPIVFMIKKRSQQQIGYDTKHQRYIANEANGDLHKARPDLKIADTIMAYRNKPKLPISFRQLLGKIHEQFIQLSKANLSPEQRFTIDKLVGTRLPEVLDDYLALEPDFAQNTIIDKSHNLTSQDVTYTQLSNMLDFIQQVADDGQGQVASNILANRNYLQSVYGDFYQDDNSAAKVLKAPAHDDADEVGLDEKSLYENGLAYLQDCDEQLQVKPTTDTDTDSTSNTVSVRTLSLVQYKDMIGTPVITQLGLLLQVAERTIRYSDALLAGDVSLQAFDKILSHALPSYLRQIVVNRLEDNEEKLDEDTLQSMSLSDTQQERIEQKINRCVQLLEACLTRLERAAKQQSDTGSLSKDTVQLLINTINSNQSQAQYLLDSGFYKA